MFIIYLFINQSRKEQHSSYRVILLFSGNSQNSEKARVGFVILSLLSFTRIFHKHNYRTRICITDSVCQQQITISGKK